MIGMLNAERKIILTDDGSHTICLEGGDITFHSKRGAIQESRHVFLESGYKRARELFPDEILKILEVGFGTGLNAFLTCIESENSSCPVRYTSLETHPLETTTTAALNYPEHLGYADSFDSLHLASWTSPAKIHQNFTLQKHVTDLLDFATMDRYHLVYFDPFGPELQPHLWTEDVFQRIAELMQKDAVLVSSTANASVAKSLKTAGMHTELLNVPGREKHMLRATQSLKRVLLSS